MKGKRRPLVIIFAFTLGPFAWAIGATAFGVQFTEAEIQNQRDMKRWYELESKGPVARTTEETQEYQRMIAAANPPKPTHLSSNDRTPASTTNPRSNLNLHEGGALDLELEILADQGQATWLNPRLEDTGPVGAKYRAKE